MQKLHLFQPFMSIFVGFVPFVSCLSNNGDFELQKSTRLDNYKLSSKKKEADVAVHGILLWLSMGFLLPLGILIIRMSHKHGGQRKLLFYLHIVLQVLSVLVATAGAILSVRSFENSFDNNHQRIGLALYVAVWVQSVIGFLRPPRGSKRRSSWYFVHWILGTVTSIVGIINIYTGLDVYHNKFFKNTRIWAILFTAQISFMAFFYLFLEKWDYLQTQALVQPHDHPSDLNQTATNQQLMIIQSSTSDQAQKILVPQPCSKRNALKNLFD